MPAVSQDAYLHHATGQADADQTAQALAGHETESHPAGPPSPRPPNRRSFAARAPGRPGRGRLPEHNRADHHQAGSGTDHSPGHGQGVPEFPPPLPGSHHYQAKDETGLRQALDVGPAEPYYWAGMAHGVEPSEVHHGGRPTPRPEDRAAYQATRAAAEHQLAEPPEPIPVVVVPKAAGAKPLARAALRRVLVPAPGSDPVMLIGKDPHRTSVRLLNEAGPATADATVSNPAAGSNAVITIAQACQLNALSFTAATSATAANRQGLVEVKDAAGNIVFVVTATNSQTASETAVYSFAQNLGGAVGLNADLFASMGLPNIQLQPGWTITLGLNNIQAGDQISAIVETLVTPANNVRIHSEPGSLPAGPVLPAGGTGYLQIETQDQIWAITDPAGSGPTFVSVISQYDIASGV